MVRVSWREKQRLLPLAIGEQSKNGPPKLHDTILANICPDDFCSFENKST